MSSRATPHLFTKVRGSREISPRARFARLVEMTVITNRLFSFLYLQTDLIEWREHFAVLQVQAMLKN